MARETSQRSWWSGWGEPRLASAWERIKAAMHIDPIHREDAARPRTHEADLVDLDWDQAEAPLAYGYTARMHYGTEHPEWGDMLEEILRKEWEASPAAGGRTWEDVRLLVRRGFDAPHTT